MCTYVNEINDVVTEFTNKNLMFTAWDVTVELRKKSKSRVQHYEVKKEVHEMFENGNIFSYSRTLAHLPNVNTQPWIYHPLAADPSVYAGMPTTDLGFPTKVLGAPTSTISTVDDDDVDDDDGNVLYKFDKTDRLCVPNKLVRQMGLKHGDKVEVMCDSQPTNEVKLVKHDSQTATILAATYVVDDSDNVRVTRAALNKVGMDGAAYEIEGDAKNIKIKKYA